MLLQTNSYIVPREKRSEHARLLRKFRHTLLRLGCDHFEVYEQVGANWSGGEPTGRFVQFMRFRDRAHQQQIQAAERQDPVAQQLIAEFCALINFPYQQHQGLFSAGYYRSGLPIASPRKGAAPAPEPDAEVPPGAGTRTTGTGGDVNTGRTPEPDVATAGLADGTAPVERDAPVAAAAAGDAVDDNPAAGEGASLLEIGSLRAARAADEGEDAPDGQAFHGPDPPAEGGQQPHRRSP